MPALCSSESNLFVFKCELLHCCLTESAGTFRVVVAALQHYVSKRNGQGCTVSLLLFWFLYVTIVCSIHVENFIPVAHSIEQVYITGT